MADSALKDKYEKEQSFRFRKTIDLIKSLNLPKQTKVLDIGALFGHLSLILKQDFGYDVTATDYSDTDKDKFRSVGINFTKCVLTEGKLPFDNNTFDFIVFTEVLEHLLMIPHTLLFEMNRVLKPKGYLLLTTPNLVCLWNRIRFVMGINPIPTPPIAGVPGFKFPHVKEYTMSELEQILKESRFEVVKRAYICFDPHGFDNKVKYRIYSMLERIKPEFAETLAIIGQKSA
jgi:ubiquinone/menaquinone biosynthesis C-methylase UbiE